MEETARQLYEWLFGLVTAITSRIGGDPEGITIFIMIMVPILLFCAFLWFLPPKTTRGRTEPQCPTPASNDITNDSIRDLPPEAQAFLRKIAGRQTRKR